MAGIGATWCFDEPHQQSRSARRMTQRPCIPRSGPPVRLTSVCSPKPSPRSGLPPPHPAFSAPCGRRGNWAATGCISIQWLTAGRRAAGDARAEHRCRGGQPHRNLGDVIVEGDAIEDIGSVDPFSSDGRPRCRADNPAGLDRTLKTALFAHQARGRLVEVRLIIRAGEAAQAILHRDL